MVVLKGLREVVKHANLQLQIIVVNIDATVLQVSWILVTRPGSVVVETKFLWPQFNHICNQTPTSWKTSANIVEFGSQKFCCNHNSTTLATNIQNCCRTVAYMVTKISYRSKFTYFATSLITFTATVEMVSLFPTISLKFHGNFQIVFIISATLIHTDVIP